MTLKFLFQIFFFINYHFVPSHFCSVAKEIFLGLKQEKTVCQEILKVNCNFLLGDFVLLFFFFYFSIYFECNHVTNVAKVLFLEK